MNEDFDIAVIYKGKDLIFKASLLIFPLTHKFQVEIDGQLVIFEPDEERRYRAVFDNRYVERNKKPDIELLETLANSIESIVK